MNDSPGMVSSSPIYEGRVISLSEDAVRFPDGSTGNLAIVRHPGASAVVPFLSDPHGQNPTVLLIRQYRYAAGGYLLEIPAGRFDADETPESCARRELLEETGCSAGTIAHLTTVFTTPGFCDERIHLFMASELRQGVAKREADEFIETITMPLSEVLERIEKGDIVDAKTIIALLYAAGYRTKN